MEDELQNSINMCIHSRCSNKCYSLTMPTTNTYEVSPTCKSQTKTVWSNLSRTRGLRVVCYDDSHSYVQCTGFCSYWVAQAQRKYFFVRRFAPKRQHYNKHRAQEELLQQFVANLSHFGAILLINTESKPRQPIYRWKELDQHFQNLTQILV